MAALYAQGLSWEGIHAAVQHYARQIGSVRHLLSDLTLPIISVFTGQGFDRIVREAFQEGASQIEDLWLRYISALQIAARTSCSDGELCRKQQVIRALLHTFPSPIWCYLARMSLQAADPFLSRSRYPAVKTMFDDACSYFCMSTNLSKGCPAVHDSGLLWRMVRASMTIVGLVPPVYEVGATRLPWGTFWCSECVVNLRRPHFCEPCTCSADVRKLGACHIWLTAQLRTA